MPLILPPLIAPIFGDGTLGDLDFDGAATVAGLAPVGGVYTLTSDIYAANINIGGGATLDLRGCILHGTGTLSGSGTIKTGANSASGGTPGAALSAQGSLNTGSGAGGAGISATGPGTAGAGAGSNNITGSSSGAGGSAGGANTGGAGNNTAQPAAASRIFRSIHVPLTRRLVGNTAANSSGGGGSGGCDVTVGTATSGGGGSGALIGAVCVHTWNWTGTFHADGGTGGNATAAGGGIAGGGGGGAAGAIYAVGAQAISKGTLRANGGTGGAGANGGGAGSSGTSGRVFEFFFS